MKSLKSKKKLILEFRRQRLFVPLALGTLVILKLHLWMKPRSPLSFHHRWRFPVLRLSVLEELMTPMKILIFVVLR